MVTILIASGLSAASSFWHVPKGSEWRAHGGFGFGPAVYHTDLTSVDATLQANDTYAYSHIEAGNAFEWGVGEAELGVGPLVVRYNGSLAGVGQGFSAEPVEEGTTAEPLSGVWHLKWQSVTYGIELPMGGRFTAGADIETAFSTLELSLSRYRDYDASLALADGLSDPIQEGTFEATRNYLGGGLRGSLIVGYWPEGGPAVSIWLRAGFRTPIGEGSGWSGVNQGYYSYQDCDIDGENCTTKWAPYRMSGPTFGGATGVGTMGVSVSFGRFYTPE